MYYRPTTVSPHLDFSEIQKEAASHPLIRNVQRHIEEERNEIYWEKCIRLKLKVALGCSEPAGFHSGNATLQMSLVAPSLDPKFGTT